jgi:hypothetical protein
VDRKKRGKGRKRKRERGKGGKGWMAHLIAGVPPPSDGAREARPQLSAEDLFLAQKASPHSEVSSASN